VLCDSASNTKEYQGHLLGGEGSRCTELTTLPPSCADGLEILAASISWSPNDLSRCLPGIAEDSYEKLQYAIDGLI